MIDANVIALAIQQHEDLYHPANIHEVDLWKMVLVERGRVEAAEAEVERLTDSAEAAEADRDRYREDRNLEKQMRKQAEGQRERYREALERIANDTDSEKWAGVDFKVIARHALKEVEK